MTVGLLRALLNSGRFRDSAPLAVGIRSTGGIMTLGELDGLYLVGEQGNRLVLAVADKNLEIERPILKVCVPDDSPENVRES